ncbi:MAG: hypothetical protein FJ279_09865 [Planctomycetes bacterium]|nr:hypothetical protein [Planctomycetota bacterium]
MQMARIRFAEKDRAEGLVALARRIKVVCLPDDQYLIAEANLRLLDDLGLTYEVLAVEGFDSAVRKVRNTAAAKV